VVLNNVILSTPIVCIVLVIINISIILHGHTMKIKNNIRNNYYDRIVCMMGHGSFRVLLPER